MPGPPPKPALLRRRTNKKAGATRLDLDAKPDRVPAMPPKPRGRTEPWLKVTRTWWKEVWSSPMATQFLESDRFVLGRLAILVDRFYRTGDVALMPEIRRQEERFGLSPLDRSKLHWEIGRRGDDPEKEAKKARAGAERPTKNKRARDPREAWTVHDGGKGARKKTTRKKTAGTK